MSAHTLGTCYEMVGANMGGQKLVSGEFTGSASYDAGGSTLDLSDYFADEVRGGLVWDRTGEFVGVYQPTASAKSTPSSIAIHFHSPGNSARLIRSFSCPVPGSNSKHPLPSMSIM